MQVRVLGSAAGGGLPQWNCDCPNCRAVRRADGRVRARTQCSIAVRAAGGPWFLLNASPDVRAQLERIRDGAPSGVRRSPIAGVVLTDAELDHTAGLIVLREATEPLRVYSTPAVREALTDGFSVLRALEAYCGVDWRPLEPGVPVRLDGGPGGALELEAFRVAGGPPKYVRSGAAGDWVVGVTVRDLATGGAVTYAPALAELDDDVLRRLAASRALLVDGTFWQDDELARLGIAARSARAMGHVPLAGGADAALERLAALRGPRKILVHINNTNPVLREDSPERRAVEEAGVEVAHDGLTLEL